MGGSWRGGQEREEEDGFGGRVAARVISQNDVWMSGCC